MVKQLSSLVLPIFGVALIMAVLVFVQRNQPLLYAGSCRTASPKGVEIMRDEEEWCIHEPSVESVDEVQWSDNGNRLVYGEVITPTTYLGHHVYQGTTVSHLIDVRENRERLFPFTNYRWTFSPDGQYVVESEYRSKISRAYSIYHLDSLQEICIFMNSAASASNSIGDKRCTGSIQMEDGSKWDPIWEQNRSGCIYYKELIGEDFGCNCTSMDGVIEGCEALFLSDE